PSRIAQTQVRPFSGGIPSSAGAAAFVVLVYASGKGLSLLPFRDHRTRPGGNGGRTGMPPGGRLITAPGGRRLISTPGFAARISLIRIPYRRESCPNVSNGSMV